jgi:Putative zinc ribbon domain
MTELTLKGNCESCLMPFQKDPLGAKREHEKYCTYCYRDGKLCYEGDDVNEFKKAMVDAIVARGESRTKARFFAYMAGFAPRWKNHGK